MAQSTIDDLSAVAAANIIRTLLLEVQRGSTTPTEKMDLAALLDNVIDPRPAVSGDWMVPEGYGVESASTNAMQSGTVYAVPLIIPRDVTIQALALRTGATVTGGAQARITLGTVDAAMKPLTKVAALNALLAPTTASTNYSGALASNYAAKRGVYVGIIEVDQNTTAYAPQGTNASGPVRRIGSATLADVLGTTGVATGWQATRAFDTLPSDLSSLTWTRHTAGRAGSIRYQIA